MGQHDRSYRAFFAHLRMVQDSWNEATDLGSMLGPLDPSAEIYRPQLRYKLVEETSYSREELAALGTPVAELFSIERSRDWTEVFDSVKRLRLIILPDEASLKRAFEAWLQAVILPRLGLPEESTEPLTLEGFETMLADSIDRWNRELREKSIQEGLQEGLQKGLRKGLEEGTRQGEARVLLRQLQRKFGPLDSTVEKRVLSVEGDRILTWADRVLTAATLDEVFRD